MTKTQSHAIIQSCTPILSADPTVKEDVMLDQQKITIIYCRLSVARLVLNNKRIEVREPNKIKLTLKEQIIMKLNKNGKEV